MKQNYQIRIGRFLLVLMAVLSQYAFGRGAYDAGCTDSLDNSTSGAATFTGCSGTGTAASEGTFTTGYNYTFSTTGSTVNVAITLLDNKSGVVAYVRTQTPFTETSMANAGGLNFTGTIPNQQPGATIGIAVKFAYAGGMVVTQWINYVVGNNCSAVTDTQAPTAFTATAGAVTFSSVELLLNATDDSGSVTYTITYGSNTTTVSGTSGVQKSKVISGLNPSTAYTFNVTAKDAANNTAANAPVSVAATTTADTSTACSGTSAQAAEGTFSTGYNYNFQSNGGSVTATFTLLDTDKTGINAYLWLQSPFTEAGMTNTSGLTYTKTMSGLTPGQTYNFCVKFAYANGLVRTKYFAYTVGDTCAPPVTDTQAPTAFTATAGTITSTSIQLLLNATDNSGTVNYTITYGSATVNATGSSGVQKSVVINNLTQNTPYTFSITAKDAANNVAANNPLSVQATTAVDTNTACSGTSAQAQGTPGFTTGYNYNFVTNGSTVTATFTLLDTDKTGVVAYLWTVVNGAFAESPQIQAGSGLTFSRTITGQTPGAVIQIAMKFAYAGNASTTKYFSYTVGDTCGVVPADTQAPTAFTATEGAVTTSSVELLLNATDNSGTINYTITYGSTTVNATGSSGVQKSVMINNLTQNTPYTFSITAKDAANNVAANNPLSVQATTAIDTNTACSGTSAQAQGTPGFTTGYNYNFVTNGSTVTATFTLLDTDKTGVVAYLWTVVNGAFAESPQIQAGSGLTFSRTITGQTPGAVIQIAMKFAYAGNASTTKYFSYTVGDTCAPPVVDTQAPTAFTATAGTITATSIQLLLNATDNSGSVNYAITYGATTVNATGVSGEQKSVIISNLTPETAYTFSITAKDAANNVAANNPLSVQATTAIDTNTACSGTSAQAQGTPGFTTGYNYNFVTNGSTVTATFTLLDTDKTGVVAYLWTVVNGAFAESPQIQAGSGLTFSRTITGQTPGSVIQIAMKFAYAGNASTTKYFTYTVGDTCVPPVLDTEAPENFTATTGQVTSTSVELLLNATDDSGEVTYNITYGGTTIAISGISGEQLSHVITPLSPETAYSFSIAASDDYGNQAANNAIVVPVTTPAHNNTPCAGIDSEATDGGFSIGYNYDFATNGTDVTVTFTLLDSDKTGVVAYLRQQSPLLETPMAHVSGLTYSVTLQGLTQGTLLTYAVKFAYAGGQSVTKYFDYIVGDTCAGGTGDVFTTVWENGTWSNGIPVSYQYAAVINDDYNSASNGEIIAASLSVAGGEVVVADGDNFTILGAIDVDNEATFTLQNNANLIQENNEQNTGEISVVKDSAPMYRLDYALWGSPVSGQNLQLFSENTLSNRFYTYNPVTDTYNSIAPDTNDFATGKGYLIRVANNHLDFVSNDIAPVSWTGTFKGVPNNGDINVPVTAALDAEGDENDIKGFNAISNPYPSAINIAAFFEENQANLASNTPIFFWRKKNGAGTSSYCSLTLAGYNANSGNAFGDSSNGLFTNPNNSDDWVINSGQGFIVRATSGTVSFKNSMRRAVNNNQMFRNAMDTQVEKSRLWLNITNAEGTFGQTTIAYTPTTTTGLDYGWDGTAITDGELAIYSLAGQSKLGIQARAAFDAADVVPVEYKVNAAGEYTISLDHFDGVFDQGQDIFLRDNLLGITHDLKLSPYSFTSNTGVVTARFDVVYAEALNTATPEFDSNSLIVYKQGNAINITTGATDMKSVAVYDVHGRLLYSAANVNAATTSITTLQAQGQMLIVQVGTTQGMKASRKIVF